MFLFGHILVYEKMMNLISADGQGKTVFLKTFGCQMNIRDSEIISLMLSKNNFNMADKADDADIILINTCSIRDKPEQKVYSLVGQFYPLKKKNPHLIIAVLGCVAQQEGKKLLQKSAMINLIVGTQQFYKLPALLSSLVEQPHKKKVQVNLSDDFKIPRVDSLVSSSRDVAHSCFVNIMQGCNNFCSYCVVPFTRGREISRPVEDIIREIEVLVARGAREITLLGQNVNSYGKTNKVIAANPDFDFADLLYLVAEISGLQRLRFTTSNPKDLSDKLINCFAQLDILCPFFHLPVQSGSNRVLKRMNRKYSREHYLSLTERLRDAKPDIAIATDVIVGFPDERDSDFADTMDLLEKIRFNSSFSFKYSDRPGTRAEQFTDKVAEEVKRERLQIFQERQNEIKQSENNKLIDSIQEIMIEEITDTEFKGRSLYNQLVFCQGKLSCQQGDIVKVKIVKAGKHSLQGVLTD